MALVLALYARKRVGWAMGETMARQPMLSALGWHDPAPTWCITPIAARRCCRPISMPTTSARQADAGTPSWLASASASCNSNAEASPCQALPCMQARVRGRSAASFANVACVCGACAK